MRAGTLPLLHLSAPLDTDCRKRAPREARFVLPPNVHHRAPVVHGGAGIGVPARAPGPPHARARGSGGFLSWFAPGARRSIGNEAVRLHAQPRVKRSPVATCTAAFAAALVACAVSGLVVVPAAPPPRASVGTDGDIRVGDDATCVRATRHADYVVADVAFGSPRTMLKLLLRLDVVTEEHAVRLFSTRVVESLSVECGSDPITCGDVFVAQLEAREANARAHLVNYTTINEVRAAPVRLEAAA